ncbi:MAG: hypothetical protein LBB22_02850, partial [Treponema sp.]|nr:hypothetical protein [Treponema sp.]
IITAVKPFLWAQYPHYYKRENFVNYLLSFFGVFLKKNYKNKDNFTAVSDTEENLSLTVVKNAGYLTRFS